MKFRFLSSDKQYELTTNTSTVTKEEFIKLLYMSLFKNENPSCSFVILNFKEQNILNCSTDVPIIKKCFANIFNKPQKLKMVQQKKQTRKVNKRWRSRSPIHKNKRKRKKRWRSRSNERVK